MELNKFYSQSASLRSPRTDGELGHLWPPIPAESTDKSKSLKESPEFSQLIPQEEQTQNGPLTWLVNPTVA